MDHALKLQVQLFPLEQVIVLLLKPKDEVLELLRLYHNDIVFASGQIIEFFGRLELHDHVELLMDLFRLINVVFEIIDRQRMGLFDALPHQWESLLVHPYELLLLLQELHYLKELSQVHLHDELFYHLGGRVVLPQLSEMIGHLFYPFYVFSFEVFVQQGGWLSLGE